VDFRATVFSRIAKRSRGNRVKGLVRGEEVKGLAGMVARANCGAVRWRGSLDGGKILDEYCIYNLQK
jgi:hypothetical protein